MKKVTLISGMVLTMMLAVGVAFGDFTVFIPWFKNDNGGVYESGYDTWVTFRNVTNTTVTVTLDFYDNSNYLAIATTVTVELVPFASTSYYTGAPSSTYNMGANGDRGNINITWPEVDGLHSPRQEVLGFIVIQFWATQGNMSGQSATSFLYAD